MLRFVIRRILYIIPIMFGVIVLVFLMKVVMPGDPVYELLGSTASEEARETLREQLGLNKPMIVQFGDYVWGLVSRGDLGTSYKTKQPVMTELVRRIPVTLAIGFVSLLIGQLVATPLGLLAAVKQYSWVDNLIIFFTIIGASIPGFWLALMMIQFFSVNHHWLPSYYNGTFTGLIMPVIAASFTGIAATARGTRTSMLEIIRQDYVKTARAKGQKETVVVLRHAFRNALVPVVAGLGGALGGLLGGSLIIETVFAVPGLGKYVADSVAQRNYPALQGGIIMISLVAVIINILIDVMYTFVDPRLKTTFIADRKRKKSQKQQSKDLKTA